MKKIIFILVLLLTNLVCFSQYSQYIDGFEGIQTGNLRDYECWDGSSSNIQVRKTPGNRAYSGAQYAMAKSGEYMVSQKYLFETGKTYTISFYYDISITPSTNSITVSTTNGITGTYSNPTTVNISSIGWTLYTTTFTPNVTGQGSFRIAFTSSYTDYNVLIDNIVITVPSTSFIDTRALCGGVALPVKFVSFSGVEKDGNVVINWTVADEVDNDFYIIESSVDGTFFSKVGEVDGFGTINFNHYTFTDYNVVEPVLYYRIKQVDFNGNYTYTNIIYVATNYLQEEARIYDFQGNLVYEGILLDFFKNKAVVGKNYIVLTQTKSFKVSIF